MNFSKLCAFMEQMPQRGIPASDIIVTKDGQPVFRKMVGFSDVEQTQPVTDRDMYRLYSATKIFTCTAAMRLVEEGKLHLDDLVGDYLPSFKHQTVELDNGQIGPCPEPMRIRHLFTMTGGMDYDTAFSETQKAMNTPGATTVSISDAMGKKPLHFVPGAHWRYSLCLDVLGAVIEVVSGMKLGDYFHKVIMDPLGMTDMTFHLTPEQEARLSAKYRFHSSTGCCEPIPNDHPFLGETYESGGGGLMGTVSDYIRMLSALSCDGILDGYRLLKPETIALMEENHLPEPLLRDFVSSRLYGYGWGLCGRVHINPAYSLSLSPVGEFGWDGALGAFAMVDRKNHIAMFYAQHVDGCGYAFNYLHPVLRNLVYEGINAD